MKKQLLLSLSLVSCFVAAYQSSEDLFQIRNHFNQHHAGWGAYQKFQHILQRKHTPFSEKSDVNMLEKAVAQGYQTRVNEINPRVLQIKFTGNGVMLPLKYAVENVKNYLRILKPTTVRQIKVTTTAGPGYHEMHETIFIEPSQAGF